VLYYDLGVWRQWFILLSFEIDWELLVMYVYIIEPPNLGLV